MASNGINAMYTIIIELCLLRAWLACVNECVVCTRTWSTCVHGVHGVHARAKSVNGHASTRIAREYTTHRHTDDDRVP